jgi:hypothetical protein
LAPYANTVAIDLADGTRRSVRARWVIDASGRACVLGKRLGIIARNERHPTAAIWCRFKNVRHIDDLAARGPAAFASRNVSSRRLATNHYVGRGYWVWVIPLANGETSIGVVYDRRMHRLHEERDRMGAFLASCAPNPVLAELIDGAEPRSEDFPPLQPARLFDQPVHGRGLGAGRRRRGLPRSLLLARPRPRGLQRRRDRRLVQAQSRGEDVTRAMAEHNEVFVRSYWRFFEAVYKDKYFYMGEADLLSSAAAPRHRAVLPVRGQTVLRRRRALPPHSRARPEARGSELLADAFLQPPLKRIAVVRRAMGEEGRRNDGRRIKFYFDLGFAPLRMIVRGVRIWLIAEADLVRLHLKRLLRRGPAPSFADPSPVEADAAARSTAASRAAGAT